MYVCKAMGVDKLNIIIVDILQLLEELACCMTESWRVCHDK